MTHTTSTVLVVDDTPSSLRIVSECLSGAGFDVLVAQEGAGALNIARQEAPDLILLDVMMPGMDGFETCRRLKDDAVTRDLPVIFMTALGDTQHRIEGFDAGAVDYIAKPVQLEEVLARVRTHLALRRTRRQLEDRNLQLLQVHEMLEQRVAERTAELQQTNLRLREEIAERKLTEEKYRRILTASPVPIVLYDMQGRVVYINPAFSRTFGWTQSELEGHTIDYVPEEARPETARMLEKVKRGESYSGFETRRLNKKGELLDVIQSFDVWRDPEGNPGGTVVMILDVTEQKNIAAQYYQTQKMEAIGKLTGGVAHDFNNILTVIIGVAEILKTHENLDGEVHSRLRQIHTAAGRAADLVRQLLAFSRQQILQPQVLYLNAIIADFQKMLERVIGEDISLKTVFDPGIGRVRADPGQIEQVLMNLVVNARDAMPEGGNLTIETADIFLDESYTRHHVGVAPGRYACIAVSDTGLGMETATQARIFEPFFTTKPKGKGTGLGLATVHGIVNQSGGHIWVYSEPGQGSSFKIYLPVAEQTVAATAAPAPFSANSAGNETILVVEDDPVVRELVHETLARCGYPVLEANCGARAQQVFGENQEAIKLLLTDVVMPGGQNGVQLAQALTAQNPRLKVLYMSGYTDNAIVHHGILKPGIHFIQKPFLPTELAAKIRKVLDG